MANPLQYVALMKMTHLVALLVVASGCRPESLVTDGTYQSDSTAALPDATLVVDVKGKTASVTVDDAGAPVVLELSALPVADWESGCPTNVSSVSVETWVVNSNPAVLGTLSLRDPRLLAGCGLDAADADTVVLTGTGEPNDTSYFILFHRR